MCARTLSLALTVFVTYAAVTNCQDVVRLSAGARLTEDDPPGTMTEATVSFANPTGTIQGTVSASVSRAPANGEVSRTLRHSVLDADINNASLIISSNQDVEALAEGLQFEAELRGQTLLKSSDRFTDSDVVAIKAIAKSALDTEEVFKLATVMVTSTIGTHDENLVSEFIRLLSDRQLMTAILFADPVTEFVPDEDSFEDDDDGVEDYEELYASPPVVIRSGDATSNSVESFTSSEASVVVQGDGASTQAVETQVSINEFIDPMTASSFLTGFGRRKLLCDACSPVNSFVCAHCWPSNVCVNYAWCSRAPRNTRRSRRQRRRRSSG
ncbi:hypothetical protein BSKO_05887 [Bryopsis sp. KO-2023]|nr:hypothetical protein BSKO_05887 [Bryopsis sp. KO-2023]